MQVLFLHYRYPHRAPGRAEKSGSSEQGCRFTACRKNIFDTLTDCKNVRKTSNLHPSAYIGTGTFASAAGGGCSEQKGVAAVKI